MKYYFLTITAILIFLSNITIAQEKTENNLNFSVGADVVSSFVWRGATASPNVSIQPVVSIEKKGFSFGAWGSTDINGKYKEIDWIATYTIKGFTATITDYFWADGKKYFNYNSDNTGHVIELGLGYELSKIPLSFYVGTMLYGADKEFYYDITETDATKSNFSTYFEVKYSFDINKNKLDVFVGATPFESMYGDKFSVVYTGITASKSIKITDNFSLPLFATFAFNPNTENYFAVLGINF